MGLEDGSYGHHAGESETDTSDSESGRSMGGRQVKKMKVNGLEYKWNYETDAEPHVDKWELLRPTLWLARRHWYSIFFMKWTCEFFFWYKAGSQGLFSIPVKERIPKSRKLTITIHLHSTESTPYMDLPLLNSTWVSNIPFFNIDSMYIVTYIIIHIYLVIIILILLKVKYQ